MSPLTPHTIVELWEQGRSVSPAERPLLILAAGHPRLTRLELEGFDPAARDAGLLDLREALFGPSLRCTLPCPQCRAKTELIFRTQDVRPAPRAQRIGPLTFTLGEYSGTYRLPVSGDWVEFSRGDISTVDTLRSHVVQRCLLSLQVGGHPASTAVAEVPSEVLDAVARAIAEEDENTHLELAVACPECGHRWSALFDIASFLWQEIDALAQRLLFQVHRLALAYGWTESEILRLSDARRESYLSLVEHV